MTIYEVPAYNVDTGESRTLTIELTRDEQQNEVVQIVAKAKAQLPGWLIPVADIRRMWIR
jgi:hypothetical protein